MKTYKATYCGKSGAWFAVIKQGKRIVWKSTESFLNRDESTWRSRSAMDAARSVLQGMVEPDELSKRIQWLLTYSSQYQNARADHAFALWAKNIAIEVLNRESQLGYHP